MDKSFFGLLRSLENPKKAKTSGSKASSPFLKAPAKAPRRKATQKLFLLGSRRAPTCAPQRRHRGGQKVFFASFCSQKEDSCLPATCLRFLRILKWTKYSFFQKNCFLPATCLAFKPSKITPRV
jgi:hypothetical protein